MLLMKNIPWCQTSGNEPSRQPRFALGSWTRQNSDVHRGALDDIDELLLKLQQLTLRLSSTCRTPLSIAPSCRPSGAASWGLRLPAWVTTSPEPVTDTSYGLSSWLRRLSL